MKISKCVRLLYYFFKAKDLNTKYFRMKSIDLEVKNKRKWYRKTKLMVTVSCKYIFIY